MFPSWSSLLERDGELDAKSLNWEGKDGERRERVRQVTISGVGRNRVGINKC
jgi:hypothetical protein